MPGPPQDTSPHRQGQISIPRAIALLAERAPDALAVHAPDATLTRAELDRRSTVLARHYRRLAPVGVDDRVVVDLGNSAAFVLACVAVWKLGATPVPVAPGRAAPLAEPALVVDAATPPPSDDDATPLPDAVASAWKATPSGGSTGPPKIVVSTGAAVVDPDADVAPYLPRDQVQLVSGPLAHSAAFTYALRGLMTGHALVVLPRFDPGAVLAAVARHRVTWLLLAPSGMHRVARHPDFATADLSSVRTLLHLGAPCPAPLKRVWLDRLGPERVVEVYASSESAGIAMIRGDEWLAHPGSVGRGVGGSEFRVVGPDGAVLGPGEVGEIVMRRPGGPRYRYLGAQPRRVDGWDALGDVGWLDADGYLHVVDRAVDLVQVDGTTVAPAAVEAALEAHPAVRSAAVVGRAGRVHAVLDLDGAATAEQVRAWVATRLPPAQVPSTVELADGPLRDDAGKLHRGRWRDRGGS